MITTTQLKQIGWTKANDNMIKDLNYCLDKFNIKSINQIRHFISQCSHESLCGYYTIEQGDINYFKKYDNRKDLGNGVGDGQLFRGAGYIQLTGRYNYQAFADFIDDSKIMMGYNYVAENYPWTSAGFWWMKNNMNTLCDKISSQNNYDQVSIITKKVNGGLNGFDDRLMYYNKCCEILKETTIIIEDEDEIKYKTILDVPQWGQKTIQKLMDKKLLNGIDDEGTINLTESILRILIVNDNANLYG